MGKDFNVKKNLNIYDVCILTKIYLSTSMDIQPSVFLVSGADLLEKEFNVKNVNIYGGYFPTNIQRSVFMYLFNVGHCYEYSTIDVFH